MTEHTRLGRTPRDRYLEAARKELAEFEQRENEFRKRDREERAEELRLPLKGSGFTFPERRRFA